MFITPPIMLIILEVLKSCLCSQRQTDDKKPQAGVPTWVLRSEGPDRTSSLLTRGRSSPSLSGHGHMTSWDQDPGPVWDQMSSV